MLSRRELLSSIATLSAVSIAAAGCRKRIQTPEPDVVGEEGPPQEPPRPVRDAAPKR